MDSKALRDVLLLYLAGAGILTGVLFLLGVGTGVALLSGAIIAGFGFPLLLFHSGARADERAERRRQNWHTEETR
jgi:hypothetical protein